ncbi:hypothetical protein ACE1TI_06900 [Alteribacillus sp. JSM 102045]
MTGEHLPVEADQALALLFLPSVGDKDAALLRPYEKTRTLFLIIDLQKVT